MTTGPTTRRRALQAAGAAGAALAVPVAAAAAIDKDLLKKDERHVLAASIFGEAAKSVAFEAIANGHLLKASQVETIRVLQDHAKQHTSLLGMLMKQNLGADAPLAPTREAIPGLLGLHDASAALLLALELEERAVAKHITAARELHDAQILRAVAGIVASDGQHLVVLRQLLHIEPIPSAFERGRS